MHELLIAFLHDIGKFAKMAALNSPMRPKRSISWLTPARKAFDAFPVGAREICLDALTLAAEGSMASIAKPMTGLSAGVFEVALRYRGDAWRVVYVVRIDDDLWVVHAFQKKSTSGIKPPRHEIELIRDRIKRLKEMLS